MSKFLFFLGGPVVCPYPHFLKMYLYIFFQNIHVALGNLTAFLNLSCFSFRQASKGILCLHNLCICGFLFKTKSRFEIGRKTSSYQKVGIKSAGIPGAKNVGSHQFSENKSLSFKTSDPQGWVLV